jgi:hypothetical protein
VNLVVLTPDLADRARIAAVAPHARFVSAAPLLPRAAAEADVVIVDLTRPGVLDVLPELVAGAGRVVGFAPHVETALLAAAVAAGAEAVPRSRLFRDLKPFIITKQS